MNWVHKSVDVRQEIWRKLRVNAELSAVPVRDFLAYLIEQSTPIEANDATATARLAKVAIANREAQQGRVGLVGRDD